MNQTYCPHFLTFLQPLLLILWLGLFSVDLCAATPPKVLVGSDVLFADEKFLALLEGKRVGLITNHTAINSKMLSSPQLFKAQVKALGFKLTALFAPEHGITGAIYAESQVKAESDPDGIPIYSLHGATRRPTQEMLKSIDILVYDIQDIGSRSYTYISTLFYAMEEAAKRKIPVMVLDRPNPINGLTVDGPMMEEKWRSIVGYIHVPYCHGMTIGELALFFNGEYKIGCTLHVVPMKGWKRKMTFSMTNLVWIPTSPYIPEASTAWFYPTTGILGELQIVSIGIGYTLPFKIVGAPWINGQDFAKYLNAQKFPGVYFHPFHYRPFYGKFAHKDCQGVQIIITDQRTYKPVSTQYLLLGTIKSLYPKQFKEAIQATKHRKEMFCKINGTEEVYRILTEEPYAIWKLKELHQKERDLFLTLRQKYLIRDYN